MNDGEQEIDCDENSYRTRSFAEIADYIEKNL